MLIISTLATAKPRVEPEAEAEADSEHFDTFGMLHQSVAVLQLSSFFFPSPDPIDHTCLLVKQRRSGASKAVVGFELRHSLPRPNQTWTLTLMWTVEASLDFIL